MYKDFEARPAKLAGSTPEMSKWIWLRLFLPNPNPLSKIKISHVIYKNLETLIPKKAMKFGKSDTHPNRLQSKEWSLSEALIPKKKKKKNPYLEK